MVGTENCNIKIGLPMPMWFNTTTISPSADVTDITLCLTCALELALFVASEDVMFRGHEAYQTFSCDEEANDGGTQD